MGIKENGLWKIADTFCKKKFTNFCAVFEEYCCHFQSVTVPEAGPSTLPVN